MPPPIACTLRRRRGWAWHLHAATCPAGLTHAATSAVPPVPGPPAEPLVVSVKVEWHPQVCLGYLAAEV